MVTPALSMSAALRLALINRHLRALNPASVVEVGCGQGAMGYRLARQFDYEGYEPDEVSFASTHAHLTRLGRGKAVNAPLPESPPQVFDMLVAFEVLEHIEDDIGALALWARWVPGGYIMLSVPAHPERFGPWDRIVGHYRRYSRESLTTAFESAGLSVVSIEAWGMPIGYLSETVRNLCAGSREPSRDMNADTAQSGRLLQPPAWLGRAVEWSMAPFALLQRPFRRSNFGTGYVALAAVPE